MGLSQDPEKRANQLANLQKGAEALAKKFADPGSQPAPKPKPAAKRRLPVEGYDSPKPKPTTRRAAPKQQRRRAPRADPEPEPRRSGFWDGFLGR